MDYSRPLMQGLHMTADLYRCRCDAGWLDDAVRMREWLHGALRTAGLQALGELVVPAAGGAGRLGGLSAAALLGGGHVCLHTAPGVRGVMADVLVRNGDALDPDRARSLLQAILAHFEPEWTEQRSLDRGDEDA